MKRVLVLFIVGVVLFGACSPQNANMKEKIIGTWVDSFGNTWVFSTNGNLTRTDSNGNSSEYEFVVTDTQLDMQREHFAPEIYDISISSDGKTLMLGDYGELKKQ